MATNKSRKAKQIHLDYNTYKVLAKHCIDRGTNLKNFIEELCDNYAGYLMRTPEKEIQTAETSTNEV